MYFDTPRDFIGGVYESLLYGDQPLGWDIIGRKETVRGATRETFLDYLDRWYRPERMVVGVGGQIGDGLLERLEELLGDLEPARDRARRRRWQPTAERPRVTVHTKQSDQAHLVLGVRSYPLVAPRPLRRCSCSRPCSAAACRRASSPRCASGAGSPTTSSASNHSYTDAGSLYAQAGRRHQPDRRRRHDDRRASSGASPTSRCRPTSSRRRATSPRAGSCSSSRARTGRSCSASAARCSRAAPRSRRTCSTALDAVTAEDVQRVAQDDRRRRPEPGGDRPVRRRRAVRAAARLVAAERRAPRRPRSARSRSRPGCPGPARGPRAPARRPRARPRARRRRSAPSRGC